MKTAILIALTSIVTITMLFAQSERLQPVVEKVGQFSEIRKPYPFCGTSILSRKFQKLQPTLLQARKNNPAHEGLKKIAWNFSVGQQHTWWAQSLDSADGYKFYSISTTCKAVGSHCYIFVEDTSSSRVTQAAIDSIEQAFDTRTPADQSKGIFDLDAHYFGDPPDVDNDPKIVIIILNVRDGYKGTGGFVGGYFNPVNEFSQEDWDYSRYSDVKSNDAECYYIDNYPSDLTSASGINQAMTTTAHEFQHMINFNYHGGPAGQNQQEEIDFVNEGLSESAQKLCGYDLDSPGLYFSNTDVDFTSWNSTGDALPDYSRAALFTWYLIEQFTSDVAKYIVQDTISIGIAGYNAAFQKVGSSLTFTDVLQTFALANIVNNKTIDPRYGYSNITLNTKPTPQDYYFNPNVALVSDTMNPYATRIIKYTNGKSLAMTFPAPANLNVYAIAVGSLPTKVAVVPTGTPYSEPDFGSGYSDLYFVVVNTNVIHQIFFYQSSGESKGTLFQEISNDDGHPEGYYKRGRGDTAAVWFDAMPGGSLDSIRVAFRRGGSVNYGIYQYTGVERPSPLGTKYGGGTLVNNDDSVSSPYPEPYPNWVTVDVSSFNIDLSKQIAVGIIFTSSDSTRPGLMMSSEPDNGVYHSLAYYIPSGQSSGDWYYNRSNSSATSTPDSMVNYLVHAFVHFGAVPHTSVVLSSPQNGAINQQLTLALRWSSFPGAQKYHLQFSTDQSFQTKLVDDSMTTDTTRQVGPLSYGTTYYWRVGATTSDSTVPFSKTASFSTMPAPPSTVEINKTFTFPQRAKTSDYSSADYQIIGLPGNSTIKVSTLCQGTQRTDWQVCWDNGLPENYFMRDDGSDLFTFSPGKAFWVLSKNNISLDESVAAAPMNSNNEVEIALHSGWNLITNPFDTSIPWPNIQNANHITSTIETFTNGSFSQSQSFDPYLGYYFFNGSPDSTLSILKIPYEAIYTKVSSEPGKTSYGWSIAAQLRYDSITIGNISFGVMKDAAPGLNRLNVRKPRCISASRDIYFNRPDWDERYPAFSSDFRSSVGETQVWKIHIIGMPGSFSKLIFKNIHIVPSRYGVYLVDSAKAKVINLRTDSSYEFTHSANHQIVNVFVGPTEKLEKQFTNLFPTAYQLCQNFPNPFNPSTNIIVCVPSACFVVVRVYNVLGQLVRTLNDGNLNTGQYLFEWDGKNENQRVMSSGIYYCRMEVPGIHSYAIKMLLLR